MNIDVFTIQLMISMTHIVLFVVLFTFFKKNKDVEGLKWWMLASFLLTFQSIVALSPNIRTMIPLNYIFNFMDILAYVTLMTGVWEFCRLRVNEVYIWGILILYLLFEIADVMIGFGGIIRIKVTTTYVTITLLAILFALNKLGHKLYTVEKSFMLTLILSHLFINLIWLFDIVNVVDSEAEFLPLTLAAIYVIDALIIIDLLFFILAHRRHQLYEENGKFKEAQIGISDALSKANMANKSKSIFLTNLSHELRTPLNSIMGFSEVLLKEIMGPLSEKQREFVESINESGNKLYKMISGLLTLSNIEAENVDINLKMEKPDELLKKLFPQLEEEFSEIRRKFSIDKVINDQELDEEVIRIDIKAFNQILRALLENAIKYSQDNSKVRIIHGKVNGGYYRYSVIDEGIGIDKRHFHNVFKPLNRAGFDYKAVDGVGTGLPISKGLTKLMGGRIGFKSELYVGSEFWIEFPLYR